MCNVHIVLRYGEFIASRALSNDTSKRILDGHSKVIAYRFGRHETLWPARRRTCPLGPARSSGEVCAEVSIVPRSSGALGYAQYMPEDIPLYSKEDTC